MKRLFNTLFLVIASTSIALVSSGNMDVQQAKADVLDDYLPKFNTYEDIGTNLTYDCKYLVTIQYENLYYVLTPVLTFDKPFTFEAYTDIKTVPTSSLFNISVLDNGKIQFKDNVGTVMCKYSGLRFCKDTIDRECEFTLPQESEPSFKDKDGYYFCARITDNDTSKPAIAFDSNPVVDTSKKYSYPSSLHFFKYEELKTKTSLSFSYTDNGDGTYQFSDTYLPSISFGSSITLDMYDRLINVCNLDLTFGVLFCKKGEEAIMRLIEKDPEELNKLHSNHERQFDDISGDIYIDMTPMRANEYGLPDQNGKFMQWGITIENIPLTECNRNYFVCSYIAVDDRAVHGYTDIDFISTPFIDGQLGDIIQEYESNAMFSYKNLIAEYDEYLLKLTNPGGF